MKKQNLFIFLTFTILLTNCSLKNSNPLALNANTPQETQAQEVELKNYKLINEHILSKSCVGCHSDKGGNKGHLNLETYQSVFSNKERIKDEVVSLRMPPAKRTDLKLTPEQIKALVDWIDQGAKESEESEVNEPPVVVEPPPNITPPTTTPPTLPPTPPPTTVIYFAEVFEKVIKTNCLKCHDSATEKGDVNLENYENAHWSLAEIQHQIEKDIMPPPPPRGTPLTPEQKKLILNWLNNGAPEKAGP